MALLVMSCSSTKVDELGHTDGVGFIGDYSRSEKVETDTGLKKLRYVGDELKCGSYQKVIFGPVGFYPEVETCPWRIRTLGRVGWFWAKRCIT